MRKFTRKELAQGEMWVMAAALLAYMKAHKLSERDFDRQFKKDWRKLYRKVDAFLKDPTNDKAIFAARLEAAIIVGVGETRQ